MHYHSVCLSFFVNMDQWSDKVAIVTGASSGIGEAIARALVILGLHVIGLARREEKIKELANNLRNSSGTLHAIRCDLQKEEDILNAFHYAETTYGGIDILVNAAGVSVFQTITNGSTEDFRRILEVNVLAPAIATREAVKSIRKRRGNGHIFYINSITGANPLAVAVPMSIYPASKAALRAMAINIRREIKVNDDKIKITTIYPGLVKTGIIEASGGDANSTYQLSHLQPENIADAVLYALKAPGNVQIEDIQVTPLYE